MTPPRRIAVRVPERDLLAYLTGRRALDLPEGARLVAARFELPEPLSPVPEREWYFTVEHESFAEVAWRVPVADAAGMSVPRKRVASAGELAGGVLRAAG
jgi:hypothetical protein